MLLVLTLHRKYILYFSQNCRTATSSVSSSCNSLVVSSDWISWSSHSLGQTGDQATGPSVDHSLIVDRAPRRPITYSRCPLLGLRKGFRRQIEPPSGNHHHHPHQLFHLLRANHTVVSRFPGFPEVCMPPSPHSKGRTPGGKASDGSQINAGSGFDRPTQDYSTILATWLKETVPSSVVQMQF